MWREIKMGKYAYCGVACFFTASLFATYTEYSPFLDMVGKCKLTTEESEMVLQEVQNFCWKVLNDSINVFFMNNIKNHNGYDETEHFDTRGNYDDFTINGIKYSDFRKDLKPFIVKDSIGNETKVVAIQHIYGDTESERCPISKAQYAFTVYFNFKTKHVTRMMSDVTEHVFSPYPPFYIYERTSLNKNNSTKK